MQVYEIISETYYTNLKQPPGAVQGGVKPHMRVFLISSARWATCWPMQSAAAPRGGLQLVSLVLPTAVGGLKTPAEDFLAVVFHLQ
jgi:hypothetical protein